MLNSNPVLQLDRSVEYQKGISPSRAVDAVRLLSAVLRDSPANRQSMLQIAGTPQDTPTKC